MAAMLAQAQAAAAQAPTPAPFYEEQEIHEIANELVERAREQIEAQLATARQEMIDAMMRDRSVDSGYIEVHVSLEGAYDHKHGIVYVRDCLEDDSDETCECDCCAPVEPEPVPEPEPEPAAPPCPYAGFQYREFAMPERRSERIKAISRRKVESIVGATAFSEWSSCIASGLATFQSLSSGDNTYNSKRDQLKTIITIYTLLLHYSVTPVVLRHHPLFRETTMVKADNLRRHCDYISEHIVATGCNCYATYTDLEKSTIRLLATELKGLCEEYLDMKY